MSSGLLPFCAAEFHARRVTDGVGRRRQLERQIPVNRAAEDHLVGLVGFDQVQADEIRHGGIKVAFAEVSGRDAAATQAPGT